MPAGRPSDYQPEYAERAERLAMLGLTQDQMAGVFGIANSTLSLWKVEHPEFSDAITRGGADADGRVVKRLYDRTEHDTTACIFWLKNRQRHKWRDQQDHKHEGQIGLELLIQQSIKSADGPPTIEHEPAAVQHDAKPKSDASE